MHWNAFPTMAIIQNVGITKSQTFLMCASQAVTCPTMHTRETMTRPLGLINGIVTY